MSSKSKKQTLARRRDHDVPLQDDDRPVTPRALHALQAHFEGRPQPNQINEVIAVALKITDELPEREELLAIEELFREMTPGQRVTTLHRILANLIENPSGSFRGRPQPAYALARLLENNPETNVAPDGEHRRWYAPNVRVAFALQTWVHDEATPLTWQDLFCAGLAERIGETDYARYHTNERALVDAPRMLRASAGGDPDELGLTEEEREYGEAIAEQLDDDEKAHLVVVAEWLDGALKARAEHIAKIKRSRQAARDAQNRRDDRTAFLRRLPHPIKRTPPASGAAEADVVSAPPPEA